MPVRNPRNRPCPPPFCALHRPTPTHSDQTHCYNAHQHEIDSGEKGGPAVLLRQPPCNRYSRQRALPTETKAESGTSQSKGGTAVTLSNSGKRRLAVDLLGRDPGTKRYNPCCKRAVKSFVCPLSSELGLHRNSKDQNLE